MSNDITGTGPALNGQDLDAFETRTGRAIPPAFREFLQSYNGTYPGLPADFTIGDGSSPWMHSSVGSFLGIGTDSKYCDIDYYLKTFQDRIPSDLFPIANDAGGNIILIGSEGADAGKIYFWDHEEEAEEGEPPTRRNLTFVADSLNDFLAMLG